MTKRMSITPTGEYPDNWPVIAMNAKREAGHKCEHCGMAFDVFGKAVNHVNADGQASVLTVHHLTGDKADCRHENLLVCCQACHLHIQARWAPGQELPAIWSGAPEWLTVRGLAYQESRQMRMEI